MVLSSDAPIQLETWQWVDDGEHDRSVRIFGARSEGGARDPAP